MRFIVSTSTLLKQLQAVSGALSSSTVLPILENFLFEIKDGNLTISATDLQTSMTTDEEAIWRTLGDRAPEGDVLVEAWIEKQIASLARSRKVNEEARAQLSKAGKSRDLS